MERQQDQPRFPGQETGIIRVLIKQSEQEASYQIGFELFDEEQNDDS